MQANQDVRELIELARRNEEIQQRLDQVDEFLLAHYGLRDLLRHLCRRIAGIYQLEAVTLALVADHQRLREALGELEEDRMPPGCFFRRRQELRVILGDLERPYLSNQVLREIRQCFFPGGPFVASMAVMPLWVRGEFLGTFNLGSASPKRYAPSLETHFLARLARKLATALDAALLVEQARLLERREAAVEMAGAACHELAQPLTTLGLLLEKLRRLEPLRPEAQELLEQVGREVQRMGELVQRISQVSSYVTRPYAQGLRIIDVDAAADPPSDPALEPKGEL